MVGHYKIRPSKDIAPKTELAGSENREKWQEIVEAAKALNGL